MATNPFAGDRTPTCTVVIDGVTYAAREWCLDDDVLQLGDQFACDLPNIDLKTGRAGGLSGKIKLGAKLEVFTADPDVAGGAAVKQLVGRITKVDDTSDPSGGSVIRITGADLGWHLTSTCGEPFRSLEGIRLQQLLEKTLDPTWGITVVREGDLLGRRLRQGRAGVTRTFNPAPGTMMPRFQINPGEIISEILIRYARRERVLLNVAGDGALQFFQPRQSADPIDDVVYRVEYHGDDEDARRRNTVLERPRVTEDVSSVWTEVRCFSTRAIPVSVEHTDDPNRNYLWATYTAPAGTLPFRRLHVFSEPDAISPKLRAERAKWKWQRGMFDAWRYTATMRGHSQGGAFFVSNGIAQINDTFRGIKGQFYVRSVRRSFTKDGGYRAELTMHRAGILGA